jgi:NAD(P)-dependent dehydrogenase (short-subunit alcohol dehydrogenase family)
MAMHDTNRLEGKVAVVTGAVGAIGAAATELMARRGAKIVAVDLPGGDFASLKAAIGADFLGVEADVSSEDSVRGYVRAAVERFGRIDIFFNNAGIEGPVRPIPDYPLDAFQKVFAVNVVGVFFGLKHVLPAMIAQRSGSIINSSSVAGLIGVPGTAGYNASKHAVLGLTRTAALEVADRGVRVNCINPGPIHGRMMDSIDRGAGLSETERANALPAKRYGTPAEVAGLVAFLASDDAAHINGAFHAIDGGLIAG